MQRLFECTKKPPHTRRPVQLIPDGPDQDQMAFLMTGDLHCLSETSNLAWGRKSSYDWKNVKMSKYLRLITRCLSDNNE